MGLISDCSKYYGSNDLYKVLCIKKGASESEVKRAYHKLSLKVHPDRVEEGEKEEATIKFQTLGKVYSILSDKEKRALYDESGEIDEENDIPVDRDWMEYWRLLYTKISVKDIEEFEEKYKGSSEEVEDIKSAYLDFEGDVDQMLESVLCCSWEDVPRFKKVLDPLIKSGDLPAFEAYTNEKPSKQKQRKRKAEKEAAEAEEMKAEVGLGDSDAALKQMIQSRQASRQKEMDGFFAHLEEKYANKSSASATGGKKKGKKGK